MQDNEMNKNRVLVLNNKTYYRTVRKKICGGEQQCNEFLIFFCCKIINCVKWLKDLKKIVNEGRSQKAIALSA